MSVEPGFGGQNFIPEVLPKVGTVRRLVDSGELTILVEIDGGINADTIEEAAAAGVDCFVAGSAVYGAEDPAAAVESLRRQAAARVQTPCGYEPRRRHAAGHRAGRPGQGQHISEPACRRGDSGPRRRGRRCRWHRAAGWPARRGARAAPGGGARRRRHRGRHAGAVQPSRPDAAVCGCACRRRGFGGRLWGRRSQPGRGGRSRRG